MKLQNLVAGAVGLLLSGPAFGQTVASFDGGADSPLTLQAFGEPPPPSVVAAGGNPGGFLQLTNNVNSQNNWATFDRTNAGAAPRSNFALQFRMDNLGGGGADGFSFNYYPTANFGAAGGLGSAPFTAEDPAGPGVLGFGFDTWGNGAPMDANDLQSNYSEISVFFNGALVGRVDDTRVLGAPLNLKDGAWHTAAGTVDFQGGTVTLTVDGTPIFSNLSLPGLTPFESRIGLAGRTGGANERTSIDNLSVQYVPEPGSAFGLALAGTLLLARRRS